MKKITKSITSVFLTVAMLLTMVFPVGAIQAADMDDYTAEHWAAEALNWAVDNGLIMGYEDNTIRPDNNLTRAEMATIINRAFGATILASVENFEDVDVNDWYYEEMARAVNMGTFEGSDDAHLRPEDFIRREEAFLVIARALVLSGEDTAVLDKFGDSQSVSDWSAEMLADLANREFINGAPVEGQEKNNLNPRDYITRAEFAQTLYNIFTDIIGDANITGAVLEGNHLINHNQGKVTLRNVTVNGDLVIADGVGLNAVTLTNVTITGRLVIRGGEAVKLTNVTTGGGVVVRNNNSTVNFDNYEDEEVFKGHIAKTPVTFKKRSVGGGTGVTWSGPSVTQATYQVNYYTEDLDGNYSLKESVSYRGTIGTTVNANPGLIKEYDGFTFYKEHEDSLLSGRVSNSLVLRVYYKRNVYSLEFHMGYNDPETSEEVVEKQDVKYGETVELPTPDEREGYTFGGWYTKPNGEGDKVESIEDYSELGDTQLYAYWIESSEAVEYTVEVYRQKANGEGYDITTKSEAGKVGDTVTIKPEDFAQEHFIFDDSADNNLSAELTADAEIVLKIYYNRETFKVTFHHNYVGADPETDVVEVRYGGTVEFPEAHTRTGYAFDGWWTDASNGDRVDAIAEYTDTTVTDLYAHWAAGKVNYKVEVYRQKANGDGYDMESHSETGNAGDTVTITAEDYAQDHFVFDGSADNNLTAELTADAEIVLKIYYNRETFNITFHHNYAGADPETDVVEVRYGGTVEFPEAHTRTGYAFDGWWTDASNGERVDAIAEYTDTTVTDLYAHWAAGKVNYTVEVYRQNTTGDGYDKTTLTRTADAGSSVSITHDEFDLEHFIYDEDNGDNHLSDTVAADNSTVLKIYYDREQIQVTFEDPDNAKNFPAVTEMVYYEGTLAQDKFAVATREGYPQTEYIGETFPGHVIENDVWVRSDDVTSVFDSDTVVTEPITVWPKWYSLIPGGQASYNGKTYFQTFEQYYNSDVRGIDTVKDFVFTKRNAILTAIDEYSLDDKVLEKLDFIITPDRKIKLFNNNINIVETLGESYVNDMINDALGEEHVDKQYVADFVKELLTTDEAVITEENVIVVECFAREIDKVTFEQIEKGIPDAYSQLMSRDEMIEAFEAAKSQYYIKINVALYNYYIENGLPVPPEVQQWHDDNPEAFISNFQMIMPMALNNPDDYTITGDVTIKLNLVKDLVIPKYEKAIAKFENRFGEKYKDNQYFKRLLEILTPETLLIVDPEDMHEQNMAAGLSGYTLLSNEAYYDLIQEAVIMADESGKKFTADLGPEDAERIAQEFDDIMNDYMSTINGYLDKYLDTVIDEVYKATGRDKIEIVEQYRDRRLEQADIDNMCKALRKAITGYDTTTASAYSQAYGYDHEKLNPTKFGKDNIPQLIQDKEIPNILDGFYKELRGQKGFLARAEYVSGNS